MKHDVLFYVGDFYRLFVRFGGKVLNFSGFYISRLDVLELALHFPNPDNEDTADFMFNTFLTEFFS